MVFSSTVFLFIFLPIVLVIYYNPIIKSRKFKNIFLLIASLIFYGWGEPVFIFLMVASIFITWFLGVLIGKFEKHSKLILTLGVIYHVMIMFCFKYLSFLSQEFAKLFQNDIKTVDVALPIGISFFTFQMMSYLFDVYYGKCQVQKNILYLGLYVSLFPQLIAGPIVRYETIEYEIENRKENLEDFQSGLKRFMFGLGKKALIADFLALIVDNIFAIGADEQIGLVTAWIGAIAYTLEIYFDFSGYSDMAIGLGRCFGFHFNENFNYPYIATSINDFWKRWHISLTDWFRDYVYIPLGGNRKGKGKQILNIGTVWILTGIWHGANWTFLVWGIIYCMFQLLEKFVYKTNKWPRAIQHLYTLVIVCLCWVIFRADSLTQAGRYIGYMFGTNGISDAYSKSYFMKSVVILILATILALPVGKFIKNKNLGGSKSLVLEIMQYVLAIYCLIMAAIFSISGGYSPFIYFNF